MSLAKDDLCFKGDIFKMEIKMKLILLLIILSCLALPAESLDNPHYTSIDPAVREMLVSLDMPKYAGNVPATTIAGNWRLVLTDGIYIDLVLLQSDSAIFGRGNLVSGMVSQWAVASGSVSGSNLKLDVVPESGTELYAISVDISRLPLAGTYVLFRTNVAPKPGTLRAIRTLPDILEK
jgi:hypothetical protein